MSWKRIDTAIIGALCLLLACNSMVATNQIAIDAEIILPDYPLSDFFKKPLIKEIIEPISNLDLLSILIANDTTDQHQYIASGKDNYVCVHFATDLAQNISDAGYDAGVVVRSAKWYNQGSGHMLTWIKLTDELFVVESINDSIMLSDDFNASIDEEIYVMRYESLESGYRKANEEYQRRR